MYFATKEIRKAVYYGKTIIHEIDTAHPVDARITNQGLVMFDTPNIFPEYFFISIPMFDDTIHQEIDEWLHVMKYSNTKKEFKSPYMQKIQDRLAVLKMDDDERNNYFHYLKEAVHSEDVIASAREKGVKAGMRKRDIAIAKNLL